LSNSEALHFLLQKHLLVCSAVGIGVGVGVTLVVIFTVGVVLFVLNKKRKRYVLLNSLQFNDKKKKRGQT